MCNLTSRCHKVHFKLKNEIISQTIQLYILYILDITFNKSVKIFDWYLLRNKQPWLALKYLQLKQLRASKYLHDIFYVNK